MNNLQEIYRKLVEYRRESDAVANRYPKSISYLREMLNNKNLSKEDIQTVYTLLVGECNLYKKQEEEQRVHEEFIREFPENPISWIGITNFYIYNNKDIGKAKEYSDEAISISKKRGKLVRMSLNTAARVYALSKDWSKVEKILQELLEYKKPEGSADESIDTNILYIDGIEQVREDILEKLRELEDGKKV